MPKRTRIVEARRTTAISFEGSAEHRLILVLVALKLVGIVLLFDPDARSAFTMAKSSWSRSTEWLIAGAMVLAVLRHGLGILPRTRLHLAVGAFVVVALAASIGAQSTYLALYGSVERLLGLTFVADMVVLYVALPVALRRPRDWVVLAASLAGATTLAAIYVIVQRLGIDPIVWSVGNETVRPIGTFGNAGPMGEYLVVAASATLAFGAFAWRQWRAASRVALCVGVVLVITVVQVGSRSSLLGLVAAALTIGVLLLKRGAVLTPRRVALASVLTIAALGVLLGFTNLGQRLIATVQGGELADRVFIYGTLARAVAERPMLGWGPDNVAAAFVAYRPIEFERISHGEIVDNAHSWPLQAAVTMGILGLGAVVVLLVSNMWALGRSLTRAPVVAGTLLVLGAAYWASALVTVGSFATAWIPWALLGAAAALAREPDALPVSTPLVRPTPGGWRALSWTVAAVVLVGGLTSYRALAADEGALRSEVALAAGQAEAATRVALAATNDDPGRAGHWARLGRALYEQARYREAGDAFAQAAAREPYDAAHLMNLAKSRSQQVQVHSDLTRGGPQAALAAARRAVEVDPNAADPHAALAEAEARHGDAAIAMREITIAITRYPDDTVMYDRIAVTAALALPDRAAARAGLERLIEIRERALLRIGLAKVCLAQLDPVCARNSLQRALLLEPTNIEATDLLRSMAPAR